MANHGVDVDPVQQPMQLLGRQSEDQSLTPRPPESVFSQPLQNKDKARTVKEQQLHPVTAAITKRKNRRLKRIQRHRLLDQNRQAVNSAPEVDRLAMKIDRKISAQPEHRSTPL